MKNQNKKTISQLFELINKAVNKKQDDSQDENEYFSYKFSSKREKLIFNILKHFFYTFVEKMLNIKFEFKEVDEDSVSNISEIENNEKIIFDSKHCNKYRNININLENENLRWYIIYVITNNITNKKYVGQAVSHIKNKTKYKPYGAEGRLIAHFNEANSQKKHQCAYLNNAIREHDKDNFTVETLVECVKEDIDKYEIEYIKKYNTMFPNGYNIMRGGRKIEGYIEKDASVPRKSPSLEDKLAMSERTRNFMRNKKMKACLEYFRDKNLLSFDSYIFKGNDKEKYECYMLNFKKGVRPIRAIFGGQHITIEESYNKCVQFYNELKNSLAKRLVAGKSLRV